MALLNSESYSGLSNVSSMQQKRQPGKFLPVYITGKKREGQDVGKLQCQVEVGSPNYIYNNCEEIYFIPLFIKRVWEKYIPSKNTKGESYDQLVAYGGWNDEPKIDDQCKYVYYIAGYGLDPENKKVKTHEEDIEDNQIKKDDKVLIYFRCSSTKYQGAMNLVDEFSKKAKTLTPLSDNTEFERVVVTPRRFIVKVSIGSQETQHGDKDVFKFDLATMLSDKMVQSIMNASVEYVSEFEKQFKTNKESQIRKRTDSSNQENNSNQQNENIPTFEGSGSSNDKPEEKSVDENLTTDDFDLGI